MNRVHGNGVLPSQPFTTPMPKVKPPRMEIAVAPAEAVREIAERAYAAGCEAHEFHLADCQEETDVILRDVLTRPRQEQKIITYEEVMASIREEADEEFWEREERIDRLRDLLVEAAKALPGQSRIEIKDREVRVDLNGESAAPLCIPVRALAGVDLQMVPAIVKSYVAAHRSGVEAPGMSRRDLEEIATLLDFAGARFVSKNDGEVVDIAKRMLTMSVQLAMALGRAA